MKTTHFVRMTEGPEAGSLRLAAGEEWFEIVNEALFMEQVYSEISAWYPWAADLLDALIDRNWHSCTHDIAVKYKRTDRAIQISKKKLLKKLLPVGR